MNEEETLKEIERIIFFTTNGMLCCEKEEGQAIQGLLDLYQKEKEKNKFINEVKAIGSDDVVQVVLTKTQYAMLLDRAMNSTIKDKIREKIKNLKENNNGDDYSITNVIMILKELLKEK